MIFAPRRHHAIDEPACEDDKPPSASPRKSGVCLRRLKLPSLSCAQRVCTSPRPSVFRQTIAVACGADFTTALIDNGDVWSLDEGEDGQLGLGTTGHQNKPAWVGGRMSSRNLLS